MMRLPWFDYRAPRSVAEAAKILAGEGPGAMLIAGGTDLLPNMKRRHQTPRVLVSVKGIDALRKISNGSGLNLGAGLTLTEVTKHESVKEKFTALYQAAAQVATSHLRNMGTIGGNLCLDTRCTYYNQNYEWRKAIDFCLKKDGETCWVATASKRCVAVSSTDTAPALIALNANVVLSGPAGEREIPVAALYKNDGIEYLSRRPDEILTAIRIPQASVRSTYWKLRRRGSFDFPILGVAVALAMDGQAVRQARIVLGAVASLPREATEAGRLLIGQRLSTELIDRVADAAAKPSKPLDNTDLTHPYRKKMTRVFVARALRSLAGLPEDMDSSGRP